MYFAGPALDRDPPILLLLPPTQLGSQGHEPSCPAYLLRWGLANFLPGLALNRSPLDFHFLKNRDYSCEPLHLVIQFFVNRYSVFLSHTKSMYFTIQIRSPLHLRRLLRRKLHLLKRFILAFQFIANIWL
jgi:hypothetical protein